MLSTFPSPRGYRRTNATAIGQIAITTGINVVSGTANTLSASFTDLFASTAHDCHMLTIQIQNTGANATRTDSLLNIYIGSAGNEVLLIDSIAAGWAGVATTGDARFIKFPVFIPAGTRISAKTRSAVNAKNIYVLARIEGWDRPPFWVGRGVETLGHVIANSTGTAVTPGTASEGTFTAIGTTTTRWGYCAPTIATVTNTTVAATQTVSLDVGIGGVVIPSLQDIFWASSGTAETWQPIMGMPGVWCDIPAGTALQARTFTQSGGSANVDGVIIHGVY